MKKILILLCLFVPMISFAQFEWLNPTPFGERIADSYIVNDQVILLFGENGSLFKTSNIGNSWELVYKDNIGFEKVFFENYPNGWAIMFGTVVQDTITNKDKWRNIIQYTSDGGVTWSKSYIDTDNRFLDISFIDDTKGWIVGGQGAVYYTNNKGLTWNKKEILENEIYQAIYFQNDNGWIVTNSGKIFQTDDYGNEWVLTHNFGSGMSDIFFVNDSVGYISTIHNLLLKTTDGGENWIFKNFDEPINQLMFLDEEQGFLRTNNGIVETLNGGDDFHTLLENMYLYTMYLTDDLIIASGHEIYISNNLGISWTNHTKNKFVSDLTDIFFLTTNIGWVTTIDGEIFNTKDGGVTWIKQLDKNVYNIQLNGILFKDKYSGWAIGGNNWESLILFTNDGGITWNSYNSNFEGMLNDICFVDYYTGWIVGEDGILLKTTDSGFSWKEKSFGTPMDAKDIFFVNGKKGWIGAGASFIFRTSDSGESWYRTKLLENDFITVNSIYFNSENEGWAVGGDIYDKGFISKTTDGGITWENQIENYPWVLSDIYQTNKDTIYVFGDNGLVLQKYSENSDWNQLSKLTSNNFTKVFSLAPNSTFIGGEDGMLFKYTSSEKNYINLTQPDGDELWKSENDYNISWASDFNEVDIELSSDGGNNWISLTTNYTEKNSYLYENFVVPDSNDAMFVRVISSAHPDIYDSNNNPFYSTNSSFINLITPNGNEKWNNASIQEIRWDFQNIKFVNIEMSSNNGSSWSTIADHTPAEELKYEWQINTLPGEEYLIKVYSELNPIVADSSDSTFQISPKELIISGEVLPSGAGGINGLGTYLLGDTVNLIAESNESYIFEKWLNVDSALVSYDSILVFIAESDVHLYAIFNELSELEVFPDTQHISWNQKLDTVYVKNLGLGNMNWAASSNVSWLEINGDSTGINNGVIFVKIGENLTSSSRTGFIKVTSHTPLNSFRSSVFIQGANITGIKESNLPNEYKLLQNYPNPFNPECIIEYAIPLAGIVKIVLFNSIGEKVKVLLNKYHSPGYYVYKFNESKLSSGIYFYQIHSGKFVSTKKMLLIK